MVKGKSQLILLFGEGSSGAEEEPSQASRNTKHKEVSQQIFLEGGTEDLHNGSVRGKEIPEAPAAPRGELKTSREFP